jgi:hypothetical protein
MSATDPNRVILTGENPFIRLNERTGILTRQMRASGASSFARLDLSTFFFSGAN